MYPTKPENKAFNLKKKLTLECRQQYGLFFNISILYWKWERTLGLSDCSLVTIATEISRKIFNMLK